MKVKELKDYKLELYKAVSRDLTDFEKYFLLISFGVLAFSITFIKDLVKIEDAKLLYILFVSWALFSIAVGLMLITFLSSAAKSDSLWNLVDKYLIEKNKLNEDESLTEEQAKEIKNNINILFINSKKQLKCLRWYSVIVFILGIFCFSVFVGTNLYEENLSKKEIKLQNKIKLETSNVTLFVDSLIVSIKKDTSLKNDTSIINK